MRCRRIQRLLPDYIGAELSDEKRHKVDQHLAECPGCKAALAHVQQVWDGLVQGPLPQKDEEFWTELTRGVMQEIRRKRPMPAEEKRPFLRPGWRVLVPAATVIAIIVGLIVFRGGLQGPEERGPWIAQEEQEALVEATADLSFAPLAQEAQDPLGSEMTLQEVSLVAEALGASLPIVETAEITAVLTQLYNEEDPYGELEDLTGEELEAFYQLLSSKYPYS
jgi:predicted anti-sigma-YlaC factor YlaD